MYHIKTYGLHGYNMTCDNVVKIWNYLCSPHYLWFVWSFCLIGFFLQFPFPRPFSDNMCISMMLSCSSITCATCHVMAFPIAWTAGDLATHLAHFYPFWCFSFFSFPFFPWPAWHFNVTRCLWPHMISNRPIWLTFQWLQHMRVNFLVSLNGITLSYVCIQLFCFWKNVLYSPY